MRVQFGPQDIVRIIKQRLFWFAIPFAILSIIGLTVISKLPPMYESEALLLVEDQQVPNNFVRSTIQSEAEQRLRRVRSVVLARDNLIELGEEFGVFEGQSLRRSEKTKIMRERARIFISSSSGRRNEPTVVSARLAFMDEEPARAQRVANQMMTQFQSQIIQLRRDQAGGTTEFLVEEEQKVRRAIAAAGERIARIKNDNPTALPDNRSLYESQLQRTLIERDRVDDAITQNATDIQVLLLQRPAIMSGERLSSSEQQLETTRRALAAARRQYQESYPDVIALRQQLLDLEWEFDPAAFDRSARNELAFLEKEIAAQPQGSREREQAEERQAEIREMMRTVKAPEDVMSPSEASFEGRMLTLRSRGEELTARKADIERQIVDLEQRLSQIPAVENELYQLENEQARLNRELVDLQSKRAEAERSESLEFQAKAERVVVLEQPVRPDQPTSPDKPKLALMVFALAGGVAGVLALIPEVLFAKVQSREHLKELLPDVEVIEVPRFKTADERLPKIAATASLMATTLVLTAALSWTAYQTLF